MLLFLPDFQGSDEGDTGMLDQMNCKGATALKSAALLVALVLTLGLGTGEPVLAQEMDQQGLDTVVPSISVSGIDIREVLVLLSKYSGLNFTTSKDVKGPVTVELSDVTVRGVLDVVLKDNGFNYIVTEDGIVRVMTQEKFLQETRGEVNIIDQRIVPRYVSVEDLQQAIRPLLSKDGKITTIKATNTVVVSDRPEIISKIGNFLPLIDVQTITRVFRLEYVDVDAIRQQIEAVLDSRKGQIQIDKERNIIIINTTPENMEKVAQIIEEFDFNLQIETFEIFFSDPEDIAKLVKPLLTKDGYLEVHEKTSRLIIRDIPSRVEAARDLISQIDEPPKALWVEAEILNVNLNKLFEMGVNWTVGNQVTEPTASVLSGGLVSVVDPLMSLLSGKANYADFTSVGGTNLAFTINALESRGVSQVLASPRVLMMNDEEADINIGSEEPFLVRQQRTSATGSDTDIFTQRTRRVGISLVVKPHIVPSGYVEMEVQLEDSTPRRVELSGQVALAVDQRTIDTKVIVKDGRTVALGGLIRRTSSKSKSGVPVLSQIPILGLPFRNTDNENDRQKLILFLTPHIVTIDDPYKKYQVDDSQKVRMLEKDGVMGYMDRQPGLDGEPIEDDRWLYQLPPEERTRYQPQSERPAAPVLMPGVMAPDGTFWTTGTPPAEMSSQLKEDTPES
jgi:general secretion pathway protein D